MTETRRGGGSGAPGIPNPIERRPRASQSIVSAPRDTARPRARRTCPASAGPRGPKPDSPGRPGDRAAVTDGVTRRAAAAETARRRPAGRPARDPRARAARATSRPARSRRAAPGPPPRARFVPAPTGGGDGDPPGRGVRGPGHPPPSRGARAPPPRLLCVRRRGGRRRGATAPAGPPGGPSRWGLQVARDRAEFRGGPGAVVRDHPRGFPRPGAHHGGGGRAARGEFRGQPHPAAVRGEPPGEPGGGGGGGEAAPELLGRPAAKDAGGRRGVGGPFRLLFVRGAGIDRPGPPAARARPGARSKLLLDGPSSNTFAVCSCDAWAGEVSGRTHGPPPGTDDAIASIPPSSPLRAG